MIVLLLTLVVCNPDGDRAVRTSGIDRGLFVLGQYGINSEVGADTLYLARKGKSGIEKLLKIPALRFDRHLPDKLFVADDRVVILISGGAGRYQHFFARKGKKGYRLERWPQRASYDYLGSSNVVKLSGNLLGCVWISPDFSPALSGNYLYVFSPGKLKFGRLPGDEEGYEIFRGKRHNEFELVRWKPNGSQVSRSVHRLPFWMKHGTWQLSFPSR